MSCSGVVLEFRLKLYSWGVFFFLKKSWVGVNAGEVPGRFEVFTSWVAWDSVLDFQQGEPGRLDLDRGPYGTASLLVPKVLTESQRSEAPYRVCREGCCWGYLLTLGVGPISSRMCCLLLEKPLCCC